MSTTIKTSINKVIAQGEDFPIFFRLYPYMSTERLSQVWFEEDEGITTAVLFEPPYGETCQLIFSSTLTEEFSTGVHHIRLWGTLHGMNYVLTELVISVSPAFPLSPSDEDYVYRSDVSNSNFTDNNSASIAVSTYTGRLTGPAQWSHDNYNVETADDLPTEGVQIGDTAKLSSGQTPYMICVDINPVTWLPLAIKSDQNYILTTDQVYFNCQPFEIITE